MAVRKIVRIDEEKCNGCGLCVPNCAEGALKIIDGKARLVSDTYCDGLGACLGHCPQDAIVIEEREAPDFDERAALSNMKAAGIGPKPHGCPGSATKSVKAEGHDGPAKLSPKPQGETLACGCPSTVAQSINRQQQPEPPVYEALEHSASIQPELVNWPVQMKLVAPNAPYFKDSHLLLAADCAPFAYPNFHAKMLAGRPVIIGCPKLDDAGYYVQKLSDIIRANDIKSLTVVRMEVPCC